MELQTTKDRVSNFLFERTALQAANLADWLDLTEEDGVDPKQVEYEATRLVVFTELLVEHVSNTGWGFYEIDMENLDQLQRWARDKAGDMGWASSANDFTR